MAMTFDFYSVLSEVIEVFPIDLNIVYLQIGWSQSDCRNCHSFLHIFLSLTKLK